MKKLAALLLAMLMLVSCVPALAEGEEVTELSVFFKTELNWDTPVGKVITEKTGVKLNFVSVAGDATEKLNTMLASNTLPDIIAIDRGAAANDQYITNGAVIPLDDLIEEHAPNIKAQLGATMDKVRNLNDGKVYGLPSWFQDEVAPSAVFGFNIRMNYVKELGYYEKYTEKGYFTKDEFTSLLREWRKSILRSTATRPSRCASMPTTRALPCTASAACTASTSTMWMRMASCSTACAIPTPRTCTCT